jgi:lipoprotein-anchoring transpeptidase ErfK/SrfK
MPRSALAGSKIKLGNGAKKGAIEEGKKKLIKVYLDQQIVEAYEGTERIMRFECVTGDRFGTTDRGKFFIGRKFEDYRSNKYKVDMDWCMFFSEDGKAFHQYHGSANFSLMRNAKRFLTDLVGSRGCVRLREADAKALFQWTPKGTEVVIS